MVMVTMVMVTMSLMIGLRDGHGDHVDAMMVCFSRTATKTLCPLSEFCQVLLGMGSLSSLLPCWAFERHSLVGSTGECLQIWAT